MPCREHGGNYVRDSRCRFGKFLIPEAGRVPLRLPAAL
jgi:hypothetical protein